MERKRTVNSDAMWAELDMLESACQLDSCLSPGDLISWVTSNGMVLPRCLVMYVYPMGRSVLVSTPYGYYQNVPISQILGRQKP